MNVLCKHVHLLDRDQNNIIQIAIQIILLPVNGVYVLFNTLV